MFFSSRITKPDEKKIDTDYPVTEFGGRKNVLLSNTNRILGNSYEFLGIVYLVVGIIVGVTGFAMLILYYEYGVSKEESFDFTIKTPYFFEKGGLQKSLLRR